MLTAAERSDSAPWPFQVLFFGLLFLPWVAAVRDLMRHSDYDFRGVGTTKAQWTAMLLLTGTFGAMAYFFSVHPRWKHLGADR